MAFSLSARAVVHFSYWRPFVLKGAYHHPLNLLHFLNPLNPGRYPGRQNRPLLFLS